MILEANISERTGVVTQVGGSSFTTAAPAVLRFRDNVSLRLSFLNALREVMNLPNGAQGSLVLKLASDFQGAALLQRNLWGQSGSGNSRRYTFEFLVWSGLLEDALVAGETEFVLQIQYVIAGKTYQAQPIPCTVEKTYIAAGEIPPPIPTVGYVRPWAREIFGPSEAVDDATRYVGHIDKGGVIKSLRLSMSNSTPGLSVMLKHNGVNLFTAPVVMSSDTRRFTDADVTSIFARATLLDGARIDCVTTHDETGYDERGLGLQAEFGIFVNEVSAIEVDPPAAYEFMKATLPGLDWDDEEQTGSVPVSEGGSSFSLVDGNVRVTLEGEEREWPSFPVEE